MTPRQAAERAARDAYGKLVAWLAGRSGDIAGAEDALADAFEAALRTWPEQGVPASPEAWLRTVARRRQVDGHRRADLHDRHAPALTHHHLLTAEASAMEPVPDRRLELMLACAHPALAESVRSPLMLQTVLGLDAARIASAFLVAPTTMGQRLARAKARIRDTGIPFELPPPSALAERLDDVLAAIYAAYGLGWDDLDGADARRVGLVTEALELAGLVVDALPDEPEPRGLLALMLHCEARRAARRDDAGAYVPLHAQDPATWDHALARQAEDALWSAARHRRPGRFQLEAAIQSAHYARAALGHVDAAALAGLYDQLLSLSPTVGVAVGRAAAHGEAFGPDAGIACLDQIPADRQADYQPAWATRAHLLARAGRLDAARAAFERAIGLCEAPAVRAWLQRRVADLSG